jgi:hypothetical protein
MSEPIFGYAIKVSGEYRAVMSNYLLTDEEAFVVYLPTWIIDLNSQ